MAKGEDITTRFKVDISDLKKGITEANNQIKIANSEFKKASGGMDNWAKSSDGIKAKLTQLSTVLQAQNSKLDNYKRQLDSAQKAERTASDEVIRLRNSIDQAQKSFGKNSTEVKKLQTQLTAAEKAEMQMKNQVASLTVTMNNQEGTVKKTELQMNSLKGSLKEVEQAEKNAAKNGTTVEQELTKMDEAARKTSGGFTIFKGALANLVADGIRFAVSGIKSLVNEAVNASDALFKFEQTMGFAGYDNTSIQQAKKEVKQYADETVYDLNTIANTTAQLAANGIQDYTGLTKAAGNLNAVAGGSAETFKSVALVLTQTAGAGKLTSENWRQLTNAIPGASGKLQEALLQAGAYTDNFREAMEKGEITAEEFNEAIMTLGNQPVAIEAAKSVETFEGAVGNMQAAVIDGLMKIINVIGMENITGFINSFTSAVEFLIPIIQELTSKIKDGLIGAYESLKNGVNSVINVFQLANQWIKENETLLTTLAIAIGGVTTALIAFAIQQAIANAGGIAYLASLTATAIGVGALTAATTIATAATTAFSTAMAFVSSPVTIVIGIITALIAVIYLLVKNWDVVKETSVKCWETIKKAWSVSAEWFNNNVVQPVVKFFFDMWNNVKVTAQNAWNSIKNIWSTVKDWFEYTIINPVKNTFSNLWSGIKTGAHDAWEGIKNAFSGFVSFFANLWDKIKNTFSGLGTQIGDSISGTVKNAINGVISKIESIINKAINLINGAIGVINNLPGVSIGKISKLSLPRLARGGVLDRGARAVIAGEDGTEAVVPLERNKYWISKVAGEMMKQLKKESSNNVNNLTNNNTNNFTQNIYSPKALSRIELYRQTRNLINLKGGAY